MHKWHVSLTGLFFGLILTACQPGTPAVVETAPVVPSATIVPSATSQPATPTSATAGDQVIMAGCTVVSAADDPGDSPLPPVNEGEWVLGSPDASVTFIEYGDFQ